MKIYIDRELKQIAINSIPRDYTYFSYLGHELKYWGDKWDVLVSLWSEYEIYINNKLRWKK